MTNSMHIVLAIAVGDGCGWGSMLGCSFSLVGRCRFLVVRVKTLVVVYSGG